MTCTRCQGTGYINMHQLPEDAAKQFDDIGVEAIQKYIDDPDYDVSVCDCCGDRETHYGEPGRHYTNQDPAGKDGPYQYNGDLCECH